MRFTKVVVIFILTMVFMGLPVSALGLYQPWIAEQVARETYNQKKAAYSPTDQKKLDNLANQIIEINSRRTTELSLQMEAQGEILDEFQSRNPGKVAQVEKVRYWVTYAHEAVAFQAAKNYIFTLISETNLKRDVTPTVNQFENDLSVLRKKVINSQSMVQELVKP